MQAFADCAGGGLLLLPEQIEKERAVVLRERSERDTVERRRWIAESTFVLGPAVFASHDERGTLEALTHVQRSDLLDFYDAWYRPERIVVVAVGDFDATAVEQQISANFSGLRARAAARPEPGSGPIMPTQDLRVLYQPDVEARTTTITISTIVRFARETDTLTKRREQVLRALAFSLFEFRMRALAEAPGAVFQEAGMGSSANFRAYRETAAGVTCQPAQWAAALALLEQERRRSLAYGFQPAEMAGIVAGMKESYETAAKSAATRWCWDIADDIVESIVADRVFLSPEQERDITVRTLDGATPELCRAALQRAWAPGPQYVKVMGNTRIDGAAAASIAQAYRVAVAAPLPTPAINVKSTFAYTEFGPPGKVTRRTHVDDLDLTLVEFANGVRLNLKSRDADPNRIWLRLRVGTGRLTEPRDQPGLGRVAALSFLAGGFGRHPVQDLFAIIAGRNIGTRFRVGSDALVFDATTSRNDLLDELRFQTAYLTDPGFRAEGVQQARERLNLEYDELAHSLGGPLEFEVESLLAGGDRRFGHPPRDIVLGHTPAQIRAWLAPQLAQGPIEVALVGDFDLEAAIAAVAQTLGALPARAPRPALVPERQVIPPSPFIKEYRVEVAAPNAWVILFWPTADASDIRRARRLDLLADIFADRLRVKLREQLGATYTPDASNTSDDTFTFGYLTAVITVDPAKARHVESIVRALADELQNGGISEDELARAKLPQLARLRDRRRTNGYWLDQLVAQAQEKPQLLDAWRTCLDDIESVTKPEVDALARLYLPARRASRVIVLPAGTAGAD